MKLTKNDRISHILYILKEVSKQESLDIIGECEDYILGDNIYIVPKTQEVKQT